MTYPGDHNEKCYLCGKAGGAAPEPGPMLLFGLRRNAEKKVHVHIGCDAAIRSGLARTKRIKKLGSLVGACGGLVEDEAQGFVEKGMAFIECVFKTEREGAIAALGMCEAEFDNMLQIASQRISRYVLS